MSRHWFVAPIVACVSISCSSADNGKSIAEADADLIAEEFFAAYLRDFNASRQLFQGVKKEPHNDGWSYTYACVQALNERVGVFVGRDGTADYAEAPDLAACNQRQHAKL